MRPEVFMTCCLMIVLTRGFLLLLRHPHLLYVHRVSYIPYCILNPALAFPQTTMLAAKSPRASSNVTLNTSRA